MNIVKALCQAELCLSMSRRSIPFVKVNGEKVTKDKKVHENDTLKIREAKL